MNRKLLSFIMLALLSISLFAGCGNTPDSAEPEATLPPGISKPEGSVVSTDPPIVEGRITKLTKDEIHLSVQNVEWVLMQGERVKLTLEKFAEKDIEVRTGTFVRLYYEQNDAGERVATQLERVTVN